MSSNASFGLRDQYVDRWFGDVAEEREQLFSLVYGGRRLSSKDLPFSSSRTDCPGWELLEVCCQVDPGVLEFVLSVRIYKDFPNVEVAFRVRNVGEAASGLIEELRTLDFQFKVPPHKLPSGRVDSATALIRYNLGATTDVWDFLSLKHRLYSRAVANRFVLEATEGRPSANFLPFFGVDGDGDLGVNVGIGWGGAWRSEFELFCHGQAKPSTCRITASMLKTRFVVLPGEELTQVGYFLQFREGESVLAGQNRHRRFMLRHHFPRDPSGRVIPAPISLVTWGGMPDQAMLDRVDIIQRHRLPYEVFWIDAGWSGFPGHCPHFFDKETQARVGPSDWPIRVGNWDINTVPHPEGLRKVSDAARAAGMKFLAWFEPERIHAKCRGTILEEHPEWLVKLPGNESMMLELGNPEALDYIFNTLKTLIEEQGIDIYREDFNFNTLPYWASLDGEDRVGVAEMKHVAAHWELWERLHQAFPELQFDTCASGGRRLDYITLSYAWPLCQSDCMCYRDHDREATQTENFCLHDWVPLHAGFTWLEPPDDYEFYSSSGNGISVKIWSFEGQHFPEDEETYNWDLAREQLNNQRKIRDIQLNGNIQPLTKHPEERENWCAHACVELSGNKGYILAFRRPGCATAEMTFMLDGVDATATYELQGLEGFSEVVSGKTLASGFQVVIPQDRGVQLIFFKRR